LFGGIPLVTIYKTKIENAFDTAKRKAQKLNHMVLLSIVEEIENIDPLAFFHVGHSLYSGERFLWKDRDDSMIIASLGVAYSLKSNSESTRFSYVENEWKRLTEESVIYSAERWEGTGPLLFGGFTFDPLNSKGKEWKDFSHSTFQLPKFMVTKIGDKCYFTINAICSSQGELVSLSSLEKEKQEIFKRLRKNISFVKPELHSSRDVNSVDWKQSVSNVVAQLKKGEMEKVVLARKCEMNFQDDVSTDYVVNNLWVQQPDSFIFSLNIENSCFIGATPERLVRKSGENILSTCLAGSIARGSSLEEDEKLGLSLLSDQKNRYEHHLVVENIKEALAPYCHGVEMPETPKLMKMKDIQHLYTPVIGKASKDASILEIVERMHPTPALGGVPREKAMETIRKEENMDRGFYAAPIGWLDSYGNGEFAVAIRSGLINKNYAYLYAGCGIVADSEPESEFLETEMKFRPMIRAIGGNTK
jgi:menaquinone-specific isochorismate synthase